MILSAFNQCKKYFIHSQPSLNELNRRLKVANDQTVEVFNPGN